MPSVEWPGHPGQLFDPTDVSVCRCIPPEVHTGADGKFVDAEVILRSGARVNVGRGYAEPMDRYVRLFGERVEQALADASAVPPIQRCTECTRSLTGRDLQAAQCDPAGRLTCSDCERANIARALAAFRSGHGPTPCNPSDYPESCDPFPDERGEQT